MIEIVHSDDISATRLAMRMLDRYVFKECDTLLFHKGNL